MSSDSKEAFEQHIAPLARALGAACEKYGIPFLVTFQVSNDGFRTSACLSPPHTAGVLHALANYITSDFDPTPLMVLLPAGTQVDGEVITGGMIARIDPIDRTTTFKAYHRKTS